MDELRIKLVWVIFDVNSKEYLGTFDDDDEYTTPNAHYAKEFSSKESAMAYINENYDNFDYTNNRVFKIEEIVKFK